MIRLQVDWYAKEARVSAAVPQWKHLAAATWGRLPEQVKAGIFSFAPATVAKLRRAAATAGPGQAGSAAWLNDRLWMGYSGPAREGLVALAADESASAQARLTALKHLANWTAANGDNDAALSYWRQARGFSSLEEELDYAGLLNATGRGVEAAAFVEGRLGGSVAGMFERANNWHPTARPGAFDFNKVLDWLNAVFVRHELAPVRKINPGAVLSLDNITGDGAEPYANPGALATIIVPAFNAADTIGTALRSLAEQTWSEIEVLVVDDASTDATPDVVSDFCRSDSRFRLIRQAENSGSYAGRNVALAQASGKYVTIHDADDWAHPQRVEMHVSELEASGASHNLSRWIRATPGLFFIGKSGSAQSLPNYGSLTFRRDASERLGGWNAVRISADREFVRRLEDAAGGRHRNYVGRNGPLVLGRVSPTSLTRASATHINTMYHGIRREYHEATDYWHRQRRDGVITIEEMNERCVRTAPFSIAAKRQKLKVDLLLVGDWNMRGGTVLSALNIAKAARRAGKTVAILHFRRYDLDPAVPLAAEIRKIAYELNIRIVAPGESLEADTVVVTHPPIFAHPLDRFPQVGHRRLIVLVNQLAERNVEKTSVAYDVGQVMINLNAAFGQTGEWAPISNRVRRIMEVDPRYPEPSAQTWTPLIDTEEWFQTQPSWRGATRQKPRVGRHGRDHELKWPALAESLRAAYCADRPCEVMLLGGADHAQNILGRFPSNWTVLRYGGDVKAFLADLDFFVHYPNETYIEEFGRAPMEAMAAGVPVILPPVFRQTFGDAALYAEPADVWPAIDRLWRDQQAWLQRVEAGRKFVAEQCSYDALLARLDVLDPVRPRTAVIAPNASDG